MFLEPIKAHGIKAMSMSMLMTDRQNADGLARPNGVRRAAADPEADPRGAIWTTSIVDMPPGTGDIQLTLSQAVPVSGAVIVTTPTGHRRCLMPSAGIEMFNESRTSRSLGVVENMSYFACGDCGKRHDLFGSGGGARVAKEYGTELLGEFPLAPSIREQTDAGRPTVASDPDSDITALYRDCARRTAAALWRTVSDAAPAPAIRME